MGSSSAVGVGRSAGTEADGARAGVRNGRPCEATERSNPDASTISVSKSTATTGHDCSESLHQVASAPLLMAISMNGASFAKVTAKLAAAIFDDGSAGADPLPSDPELLGALRDWGNTPQRLAHLRHEIRLKNWRFCRKSFGCELWRERP